MRGASRWTYRISLALFACALLAGQQDQIPIRRDVSVSIKLITVRVTDKKGAPIRGLEKDDFVVVDNGRPVTVTEFERHEPTDKASKNPAQEERLVPSDLGAGLRMPLLPRRFLLFMDFAFSDERGIRKAGQAALHFLDSGLRPGDEVGFISYSALKGLAFHELFTADPLKVRRAVEAAGKEAAAGRAENIEAEYWRAAGEDKRSGRKEDRVYRKSEAQLQGERNSSKAQALRFLEAVTALARSLRIIPGEKDVLLFSGGIVQTLLYGNQAGNPQGNDPREGAKFDMGDPVLREANDEMMKELSAAACVVYSFDTREASKPSALFDYDRETFEQRYRDIFGASGVHQPPVAILKDDKLTGQYAIGRLAVVTGGRYFSNIDDYRASLARVGELTDSYYVLGYPYHEAGDGAYRTLKVEVRKPGCVVRAPDGYFASKPYAELSDFEKRIRLIELALNEASPLAAPLGAEWTVLTRPGGPEAGIQLMASLASGPLAPLAGKRVEVVGLIFDEHDQPTRLLRSEAALDPNSVEPVFYSAILSLQPGPYRFRLIFRNLETGKAGVAAAGLTVPGRSDSAALRPGSPLILLEQHSPLMIEQRDPALAVEADPYRYDRSRFIPAGGVWPSGQDSVHILIPIAFPEGKVPALAWSGYLSDSDSGERLPLEVTTAATEPSAGLIAVLLRVAREENRSGRYTLTLEAEDLKLKSSFRVETPIIIQ